MFSFNRGFTKEKAYFLVFNLLMILAATLMFFKIELNDHMLSYIEHIYNSEALRYPTVTGFHLYIYEVLNFSYRNLGFSPNGLINLLKASVLLSFYLTAIFLYKIFDRTEVEKSSAMIFSLLLIFFPPIFSLYLILEDNILYFPFLILAFDNILKLMKEKRLKRGTVSKAIFVSFLISFSIFINGLNVILGGLILFLGLFFYLKRDLYRGGALISIFFLFIIISHVLYFPFETFNFSHYDFERSCNTVSTPTCNPLHMYFPEIFSLPQGISAKGGENLFSKQYFETLLNLFTWMTAGFWSSVFSILFVFSLFVYAFKNCPSSSQKILSIILSGAFLFFALYFEPGMTERWDYFYIFCFVFFAHNIPRDFQFSYRSILFCLLTLGIFSSINGRLYRYRMPRYIEEAKLIDEINIKKSYNKVFLSWDKRDFIFNVAVLFPSLKGNIFLYKLENNRCEFFGEDSNNPGLWHPIPRRLPESFESVCNGNIVDEKILIL